MCKYNFKPERKKCLMCGSTMLRRYKADAFDSSNDATVSITECKVCSFAWQFPLGRNEKESVEFFKKAYQNEGQVQSDYFLPERKRDIAKLEVEFITSLPVEKKTILDIGAGAGIFAEVVAENGWDVCAIDPALDTDRISKNKNIQTVKGTLEDFPNGKTYNIVTLWDVIEHVTNPAELVESIKNYIHNGGWIVIETGNFKSVDRINGGYNHWIYQLDHRWYFSPESIKKLLKEAGFSDFIFAEKVLRPGWFGDINYAGPSRLHLLRSLLCQPLHSRRHVSNYVDLLKAKTWEMAGIDIFAVAARKVKSVE